MSAQAASPITTETKLSLPLNGSIFTTTYPCATEKEALEIGVSMEGELGDEWKDSLVISCNHVPADGNKRQMQIVHARIPREVDQIVNNWEWSTCSIGGRQFPSVQRTVILLSKSTYAPGGVTMDSFTHDTPAIGTAMPFETGSQFTGEGYILADRQVASSGMQLEPVFRVERRNYINRSVRKNIGVDPLNGKALWSETSLYYKGEQILGETTVEALFADPTNVFWGLIESGHRRTGEQLSCSWYAVHTEQVVAGVQDDDGFITIDSFESDVDYSWPPVLNAWVLKTWVRRNGGADRYPFWKMKPEGYYGPCNAVITRTWKSTPFTGLYSERLLPTPIHYGAPFFNLNIPECLHPLITIECEIGNSDPDYEPTAGDSDEDFPATTKVGNGSTSDCTTWPSSLRANDEQVPFRGGYLRTIRIVDAPNT